MTKEEILGIATGQAAALENANSLLQRFNQPAIEPAKNRFDLDLPDDEYLTGKQVKGLLVQLANQPTPTDQNALRIAATNAYGLLRLQFADEFKRWEPEIRSEANKLPMEHWNVDNLTWVVKLVRSNHIDELAAEKAQRLVDESHPTIRSGSGGSGSVPQHQTTLESDTVPAEWLAKARQQGITEATVTEFCQTQGVTREQFYADLAKSGKGTLILG